MDEQTAIDRITENENLTDGLEDEDADWLINWGISHVREALAHVQGLNKPADEDAEGNQLNALMAVMRKMNQIAADRNVKASDALASDVLEFVDQYAAVFGSTPKKMLEAQSMAQSLEKTTAAIHTATPRETMQHLLDLVQPAAKSDKPQN